MFYTENDQVTIVQVKHYCKSKYSNLKQKIKEELKHINFHKPNKYILITSLELSLENITELQSLINTTHNCVISHEDIIDLVRINDYLNDKMYSEIVEKHYKLWIASTQVMKSVFGEIVNNAQNRQIKQLMIEIENESPLYTYDTNFHEALEIVEKKGFVLIHGNPGVGKTTLARQLIQHFINEGYRLKYTSSNDLEKIDSILDGESKDIVFLDDFLGSNFNKIFNKHDDNQLEFFLRSYLINSDSKLILTTRTSILNKGYNTIECLDRLKYLFSEFTLKVEKISIDKKVELLVNHAYHNLFGSIYFETITDSAIQRFVVTHKNYNPRLIATFTNAKIIEGKSKTEYEDYIKQSLMYPEKVWEKEYLCKISIDERILIDTLLTLGGSAPIEILENAFNERLQFEIENNSATSQYNQFISALKISCGSFITLESDYYNNNHDVVKFANPSIVDFLLQYFERSPRDQLKLVKSIKYTYQLNFFGFMNTRRLHEENCYIKKLTNDVLMTVKDVLLYKGKSLIHFKVNLLEPLELIITSNYSNDRELLELEASVLQEHFESNLPTIGWQNFYLYKRLVSNRDITAPTFKVFRKYIESLASDMFNLCSDIDDFGELYDCLSKINKKFAIAFFNDEDTRYHIVNYIDEVVSEYADNIVDDEWSGYTKLDRFLKVI